MECIARIVVGKCIKNEKFPNRILIFFFTQILPIMVRTKHKNGSPIKGSLLCVHNFFFSSNSVCGFAIRLICSICPKSWFDGVVVTTLKNSLIAICVCVCNCKTRYTSLSFMHVRPFPYMSHIRSAN